MSDESRPILSEKVTRAVLSVAVPAFIAGTGILAAVFSIAVNEVFGFFVAAALCYVIPLVVGHMISYFAGRTDERPGCALFAALWLMLFCAVFPPDLQTGRGMIITLPFVLPILMAGVWNCFAGHLRRDHITIIVLLGIVLLGFPTFLTVVAISRRWSIPGVPGNVLVVTVMASYVLPLVLLARIALWMEAIACARRSTAVHEAARDGNEEMLIESLAEDDRSDLRLTDNDGRTPLHVATEAGQLHIVELLIRKGAEVDVRDYAEQTPLHYAAHVREPAYSELIAERLIENGADMNAVDRYGHTPLHHAAYHKRIELARVLMSCGANAKATDTKGRTPLDIAVERGHGEVAEIIRRHIEGRENG
ncbi:MAG: ankyrin repeat domain-containing protein [Planctomycetota bacterium]